MINRRWRRSHTTGQSARGPVGMIGAWIRAKLDLLGRNFVWVELSPRSSALPPEPVDNGPFGRIGPDSISSIKTTAAAAGRLAASPFGALITITVGDSAVRVLVARGIRVRRWAEAQLPPGVVQDGLIVDEETFSEALNAVIDEIGKNAKLNGARVAVAITGRNIVQRRFTVFLEEDEDLAEAVIEASADRMSIRPEELQLAWDAARADYGDEGDDDDVDEIDALEELEAELEPEPEGEPYDVYAFGMYRHVLRRNLRALAEIGAKFSTVQPKPLALASAVNEKSAIILDIESTSLTVIVLRDGLPEVVREVGIDERMTQTQWVQSVTTQVSRTVAFHDSMYPESPLGISAPLFVTGAKESVAGDAESAAQALPYPRRDLPPTLRAPSDFPASRYAANVGLTLVTGKHWWQRTKVQVLHRAAFDFRPAEFRPRPFPIQAVITAGLVAALLVGFGSLFQFSTAQQDAVVRAQGELTSLQRNVGLKELRVRRAAEQRKQITELQAQTETLLEKIALVKDRDRGFAMVANLLADRADEIDGVEVSEIDDDGKIVEVSVKAVDFISLLRFVRLLEAEEGFVSVQFVNLNTAAPANDEEGDGANGGVGTGTGAPGAVGGLGGQFAAPDDVEKPAGVTVRLRIERTEHLEPPVQEPEPADEVEAT